MHIDFECSGGFANLRLACRVDTSALPEDLAQEISQHVYRSGLFDLQPNDVAPASPGPPDLFFYRLSISDGNRKQSLSCNDVSAPVTLRPLLAILRKLAVNQKRNGH